MKNAIMPVFAAALLSQCAHQPSSVTASHYGKVSEQVTKSPRQFSIAVKFDEQSGDPSSAITVKPGKKAIVAMEREFVYPTKYLPAQVSRRSVSHAGDQVIPSTPTDFRSRNLGYRAELTAKSHGGYVLVEGLISHEKFSGFTRAPGEGNRPIADESGRVVITENRTELPHFVRSETPVHFVGLPGVPHLIDLPGVPGSATITVTPVD